MIKFSNVTKRFGNTIAIDQMTLDILENGIYCLLGRNGAGKTTLMKLLAGHIKATDGTIAIADKVITPMNMQNVVHFIDRTSDQFNMQVMDLIESASVLQEGFDKEFAREMVKRLELNEAKKYKQLSLGMKTMINAILTLANNSPIILLDEPTLGFDAIMRNHFNTLLLESYQAHPRIIIVSTHLIDEISRITEHLVIIDNGKLLLNTNIDDVDEHAYTLTGPAEIIMPLVKNLNCLSKNSIGSMAAAYIYDDRITPPNGVIIDRMTLQDFFIQLVGGKDYE